MGRITIIKSLALSKFVHLFISLPDPPKEFLKQLVRIFYKFIWNNGPDRIKRNILTNNLAAGGMRMVQLNTFIKALKITWLRRILQQTDSTIWSTLSKIKFCTVLYMWRFLCISTKFKYNQSFLEGLLKAWSYFCNVCDVDSIQQLLYSSIWLNTNFI